MSEVEDNIRNYLEILNLKCECCGELGSISITNDNITVTNQPKHYGIKNVTDWETKVGNLEKWLFEHRSEVASAMTKMDDLDPELIDILLDVIGDESELIGSEEYRRVVNSDKSVVEMIALRCTNDICTDGPDEHRHHFRSPM